MSIATFTPRNSDQPLTVAENQALIECLMKATHEVSERAVRVNRSSIAMAVPLFQFAYELWDLVIEATGSLYGSIRALPKDASS
jgi:hypothetical protein